jgi:hypothetical protein
LNIQKEKNTVNKNLLKEWTDKIYGKQPATHNGDIQYPQVCLFLKIDTIYNLLLKKMIKRNSI